MKKETKMDRLKNHLKEEWEHYQVKRKKFPKKYPDANAPITENRLRSLCRRSGEVGKSRTTEFIQALIDRDTLIEPKVIMIEEQRTWVFQINDPEKWVDV